MQRIFEPKLLLCLLFLLTCSGCLAGQEAVAEESVILAAGDIARCNSLGQAEGAEATAQLLKKEEGTILALGDLAYRDGSLERFQNCYAPVWGQFKDRTKPVPGNHDYRTKNAKGYFAYWDDDLVVPGRGYYSFELGSWHLIALDSNLKGEAFSRQMAWLKTDLAETQAVCILAYWHHPLTSSLKRGAKRRMKPIFDELFTGGVSVVLAGHDHVYERFLPHDPAGMIDEERGIRSFTVGTGGAPLYEFADPHPLSAFRQDEHWGVLRMLLKDGRYDWEFLTVDGDSIDRGSANCVLPVIE